MSLSEEEQFEFEEVAEPPLPTQIKPAAIAISMYKRPTTVPITSYDLSELDLMPVRCKACGKVLHQVAIENLLKSGHTLKETLDQLGYRRECCRMNIQQEPAIVKLQKSVEREKSLSQAIADLTLERTSGLSDFPHGGNIQILDSAPPGVTRQSEFCIPQADTSYYESETGAVETFEHYLRQFYPDEE